MGGQGAGREVIVDEALTDAEADAAVGADVRAAGSLNVRDGMDWDLPVGTCHQDK